MEETVEAPDTISAQEIFAKVYTHFVTNNQPRSMDAGGTLCMYRGEGGAKCALGVLIEDDEYDEKMEGADHGVTFLFDHGMLPARLVPHVRLIQSLQRLHDARMHPLDALSDKLKRFAARGDFGVHAP